MLSPSWPSPERAERPAAPPHIQRRVDAAQRRALRAAVSAGGIAIVCFVALDAALNLVTRGEGAATMARIQIVEMVVVLVAAAAVHRGLLRPDPIALVVLLIAHSLTYVGFALDPTSEMLSAAELALVIVGSGLFLPWTWRWHAAWLTCAEVVALVFAVGPFELDVSRPERMAVLPIVAMSAITSVIGQFLWQGRLRRMVQQQFELRWLSRYSQRQEARLSDLNRQLNHTSRMDALTGVGNRLALDEALAQLLDQGDRVRPMPFALILLDLDRFKRYNDRHGHLAGDVALGRVGAILRHITRGKDLAFRYGGEEFLVLLPEVNLPDAVAIAERIRESVEEDVMPGVAPFTISGGVALCDPADGRDPTPLLRRADGALYIAKRGGRNRIATDELSVAMQRREIASA